MCSFLFLFFLPVQRYWMGVFMLTRTNSCAMRIPSIGATLSRTPRLSCWWYHPTTATLDVSTADWQKTVEPVTLDENQFFFLRYLLWSVKATHMPRYCRSTHRHMHPPTPHQQQSCPIPFYSFCLPGGHLEAKSHSVRSTCEPLHCYGMLVAVQRGPWSCCLLCSFKISVILTAGLMLPTSPVSPHPLPFVVPAVPQLCLLWT